MKSYELRLGFSDPRFGPYRAGMIAREVEYRKQVLPQEGYDRLVVVDCVTLDRTAYRLFGETWVEERDYRRLMRDRC